MSWLFDIGNTAIKWAVATGPKLACGGEVRHAQSDWLGQVQAGLAATPAPAAIAVSSVADRALGTALCHWLREYTGVRPRFASVEKSFAGLTVAYATPENLGVDRWLAMLGARACQSGPFCVADVGTAMTLDAVAADGRHLGGLIAPGPGLMATALIRNTAQIDVTGSQLPESPFATDTAGAVRAGAVFAAAALVERFAQASTERFNSEAVVWLTGGARQAIAPLLAIEIREQPDLVLIGLQDWLQRSHGG